MFLSVNNGVMPSDEQEFYDLVSSMLPDSGYFLCQGLPTGMDSVMGFQTKSLRQWCIQFNRLDHKSCSLWLKGITKPGYLQAQSIRCKLCTNLMYYIKREGKKRQTVTPKVKTARTAVSSHFPIKYLSPHSATIRRESALRERKSLQKKVSSSRFIKHFCL